MKGVVTLLELFTTFIVGYSIIVVVAILWWIALMILSD